MRKLAELLKITIDEFIEELTVAHYEYACERYDDIKDAYITYLECIELRGDKMYLTPNEYIDADMEMDEDMERGYYIDIEE